jgi:arylsulfatase A-like enzyme
METAGCHAGAAFHDCPDAATPTGRITLAVEAFLDSAPDDHPWCAVASYYDPHAPHLAPRRFSALHPPESLTLPPFTREELSRVSSRSTIKWQAQGADHATDDEKRHYLSVYLSLCSYVDEQVGRLVRMVERRGESADTVIVFVSDHGDFCWQHGMCKKDLVLWDALLHIPFVIAWPGVIRHQVVDTLTGQVDVLPSLIDLLDLERHPGVQGRSLAPLVRDGHLLAEKAVFAEVCHSWMQNPYSSYAEFAAAWQAARNNAHDPLHYTAPYNVPGDHVMAVRTRKWKYIRFGSGFEELYDLENDPGERRNLVSVTARDDGTLLHMRSLMLDATIRAGDPLSPRQRAALRAAFPRWRNALEPPTT